MVRSAADYLIKLDPSRAIVRGGCEPMASNDTGVGRRMNRRIVLEVVRNQFLLFGYADAAMGLLGTNHVFRLLRIVVCPPFLRRLFYGVRTARPAPVLTGSAVSAGEVLARIQSAG